MLLDGASAGPVGDDGEQVLDIVQAIGMAPGLSQVRVYIGRGSDDSSILNAMASENIAKQLSCSWGWRPADPTTADPFFQEMAAQGQSFFTASGDDGAFYATISPFFFPADDQYVTAVGGTHLTTDSAGGGWVSETVWNSGGGASGGGISPDFISIPSWQAGLANSANGGSTTLRNVPDVAMEGDFDNYACANGKCSGGWAGTSFAAPRWAGYMALVNQQAVEAGNAPSGGLGFINPALYRLAQDPNTSADFHDVTSGNNQTGNQPVWFSATPGYDLTTGWGSANGQHLIDDLAGPQVQGFWLGSAKSTIALSPGGTATATIAITNAGGFSGNVNLAVTSALPAGVTASFSPNPATGSTVLTLTATSSVVAANQTITITGTSGNLTASTNVIVAIHVPTFTLTASPSVVGVTQGASGSTSVAVQALYGFTGKVDFSVSGLPSGVTASFSAASSTSGSTLTFTVSTDATPATSTVTITGTPGSISATTTVSLTIYGPSFTLSSGYGVSIGQDASGSTSIYIYDQNGFTGSVNFAVSGLPSGVTATISPNPTATNTVISFTATGTAPPGQYVVTVTGTSGKLTSTTTLNLGVYAPTFTLSGSSSASVGQGHSSTGYVYITPQYGFTGSVNLSVSGLPSGVTATWSPNPITGYNSSVLTFAASSSAVVGQYNLTITGVSGNQTVTTPMTLGVYAPTFTLSSYSNVNIGQGSSGTDYVYVNPLYGFDGSVNFSISGLPAGVTATFSPNSSTSNTVITFQASSAAVTGQYTVTITGTSGSQTVTTTMSLGVSVSTFTLSSYGGVLVGQGGSGTAYVYVNPLYGFTGNVTMSVAGLPSGVSAFFSPNPTTNTATMTLTASSAAAVGQYNLIVTGTSGSQSATTNVTLTVATPSFTLYNGGSVSLGTGASASTYVGISGQNGFTGSVSFSASGLPSGVTASFSPNPSTTSSTLTFSASNTAAPGQYTVTISGASGGVTATTLVTLIVSAPTFSIYGPGSFSLGQGTTGSAYASISGQYGFAGSVTFSVSGLPSGVTASFAPNPTAYSTNLILTAAADAPVGTSTVTIMGTSGSQTVTTTFLLSINAPGFSFYASLNNSNLDPGTSGSGSLYVTKLYGFNGNINFTASSTSSGVTVTFGPLTSSGSVAMTVLAGSDATPGTSTITVTGVSGAATASTTFTITVNTPTFNISAAPASLKLYPGSTQRSILTIVPQHGFQGGLTFSTSGLPAGVTALVTYPFLNSTTALLELTAAKTASPIVSTATITGSTPYSTSTIAVPFTVGAGHASTTTALSLTSGGQPVSSIAAGTMVSATVAVMSGSTALTTGQVNICDTTAALCEALHLIGSAQLTNNASATIPFLPAPGSHSYKAVFVGSYAAASSTSAASSLSVTASQATTTTIAQSGDAANRTLTAVVTGNGAVAPSGSVSFIDTSHSDASVASAALVPGSAAFSASIKSTLTVGLQPASVASGDFNGDGIPDLAVPNPLTSTISIFLGKGDGTFQAAATLQTPVGSTNAGGNFVAVGDFNRDGRLDLAVSVTGSPYLTVFLGNGDGTFTVSSSRAASSSSASRILVGDYNGDGLLDLAINDFQGNAIQILLGNGDGTFTASRVAALTGSQPQSMTQGDFNGDGILDLAVANSTSNDVTILLGNGDGTFQSSGTYATGTRPLWIANADFNGDGKADLAIANALNDNLTILMGNGAGSFNAVASPSTGAYPSVLAVADFNGDGKADIVTANYQGGSVGVLLGNGDGTFAPSMNITAGKSSGGLIVGDWNGDGVPDVATADTGGPSVTVLTSQLTQTATATATNISPVGAGQHAVKAKYAGDASFFGSLSAATLVPSGPAAPVAPAVLVSAYPGSVTTTQAVTVTITVAGADGNIIPSGSVRLTGGTYTSAIANLINGSAVITVSAGTLPAGSDLLTASYTPDTTASAIYTSAIGTSSITVSKSTPTVTLSVSPSSITISQSLTVNVSLSGDPGAPAPTGPVILTSGTYTSRTSILYQGNATFIIPAGTLSAGVDALLVTFTPDSGSDPIYTGAAGSGSVSVGKATPMLTWNTPDAITYGTSISSAQLNATANVPGTWAYSPAAGVVLNAGTQTLGVTFTPTDSANYTTGAASVTLTVNKATPVISWPVPAPISYGTLLSAAQLNATASVAGSFVYTPASGALLPAGVQTLSATFTSADATNYLTASATVPLTVNQVGGAITWTPPAPITYGTALGGAQLNATSSLPGTFAYAPAVGTILSAGSQTLTVTFTPADTVNAKPEIASVLLVVNKATPTISWPTPAAVTYGTALGSAQLNATSSVPGTFSYTPAAGSVPGAGTQTLAVAFVPTDATDYKSISANVSLVVNKATPVLTWPTPAAISYGTALSSSQLNATASVAGTFAYTPASGTVLPAGNQTLSVTLTPSDSVNYGPVSTTVPITVNAVGASITWSAPASITYGTALGSAQLNAMSLVPGTFAYSPAAGTVLGAGSQTLSVTFTPTDTATYRSATSTTTLTVNKAPVSITAANVTRPYGTANPAFTGTLTGAVNGDVLTESFASSGTSASVAGTYSIVPTVAGVNVANYVVSSTNGILSITQAATRPAWRFRTRTSPSRQP